MQVQHVTKQSPSLKLKMEERATHLTSLTGVRSNLTATMKNPKRGIAYSSSTSEEAWTEGKANSKFSKDVIHLSLNSIVL